MFAFECWHQSMPEYKSTWHGLTASKARVAYYRHLRDCCHDIDYKDIRSRKAGLPRTTAAFLKTATYRGVPFARIGQRVKVEEEIGIIVGCNSSANFDVFFEKGKHRGLVVNCHPGWHMMICVEHLNEPDTECPQGLDCGPCQKCLTTRGYKKALCYHECSDHNYTTDKEQK